jgi:ABC-type branched-subunit amino acid transport system substrate-binding protein
MGTMFDMVEEEGRSNMRSFSAGKRTGTLLSVVAAIAVQGACGSSSVTPSADAEMAADATAAADVTTVPDTTIETSTGINAVTGPATVGFLMPATGSLADQAVVWVAAVQLAQTEINAAGGLMGRPLVLDIQDSKMDNATAAALAPTLLDDAHASFLLTADGTAAVMAVMQATLPKPAILLASTASGDELVAGDTTDSVFRTVASVTLIGGGTARAALDRGAKTMAILEGENPYTLGCGAAAAAYFQQYGGTITATVQFPYAPDPNYPYSTDLATASVGAPDAIYLVPHPSVGITFLKAWTAAGAGKFAGQWYLNETLRTSAIPNNVGVTLTNGMRGVCPAGNAAGYSAMLAAFTAAYGTTSGDPTIPRVAENYDAVYLMALAIAQAGTSTDVAALRIALRAVANPPGEQVGPGEFARAIALIKAGKDINYEGASGTCDFDDQGNVNPLMAEWELQNGNFMVLRTFSP